MNRVKRNNTVIPALMNEIFKPDWFGGIENLATHTPAVNIQDNEKNFELALSVPGRNKEDFKIDVENELLTVSYQVKKEETAETTNYTRREFRFNSFKRSFTLPDSVDAEQIEAKYENGILEFVLPKREEALPKPKRVIDLS